MRTVRNSNRLQGGVPALGVWSQGVPGPGGGGCLLGGGGSIPACTEADPTVDRHKGVKT